MTGTNCDFDPVEHVYTQDHVVIPGVTEILQEVGLVNYDGIPESTLRHASERGTYVHSCCQAFDAGELDESQVHPEAQGYLGGYKAWKSISGFRTHAWGKPRVAEVNGMKFGMTEDVTGWMQSSPWLVDVKCTAEMPESVKIQTALYATGKGLCLVNKDGIVSYDLTPGTVTSVADPVLAKTVPWKRAALQLFPDATFKFDPHSDPLDEMEAKCALFLVTRRNNRRKA